MLQKLQYKTDQKGFTLIELMIVIAHHRHPGGHRHSAVQCVSCAFTAHESVHPAGYYSQRPRCHDV